jgi:hypothetical protein
MEEIARDMEAKIEVKLEDKLEGVSYVIDPKALSREDLYGVLDPNEAELIQTEASVCHTHYVIILKTWV